MIKKSIYMVFLILIIVLLIFISKIFANDVTSALIEKYNYCEQDSDCEVVGVSHGACLGCYALVNKKHVDTVKKISDRADRMCELGLVKECGCMYDCTHSGNVECVKNKCVNEFTKKYSRE